MQKHQRQFARRRGLAPLELVLAIPILMFVLALSVIFGAVTCWKIRGEVAARDAVFSSRWPRRGAAAGPEWRVPRSRSGAYRGADLAELDHPVFQNPLIRGPLPNGIAVNDEMLDL